MDLLEKTKTYATNVHENANNKYGENNSSYVKHLDDVHNNVNKFNCFLNNFDFIFTSIAAYAHDVLEDTTETYNDLKNNSHENIADIVWCVTDIPHKNRFLKQIHTLPKTITDHRAIILKLCDIYANASYSKSNKSSMFNKYVKEYNYKRPIFINAIELMYLDKININKFYMLIDELDEIHNYKIK